jgi:hypothetical protein
MQHFSLKDFNTVNYNTYLNVKYFLRNSQNTASVTLEIENGPRSKQYETVETTKKAL